MITANSTETACNGIAVRELGRFLRLATRLKNQPMTMFSACIDHAWHALLEDKERYESFCRSECGTVLGHLSSEECESKKIFSLAWTKAYEEEYGPLPAVWFADKAGVIDAEAYERFRSTGELLASWSCTPSSGGISPSSAPQDRPAVN
jgi:hypothetical protein